MPQREAAFDIGDKAEAGFRYRIGWRGEAQLVVIATTGLQGDAVRFSEGLPQRGRRRQRVDIEVGRDVAARTHMAQVSQQSIGNIDTGGCDAGQGTTGGHTRREAGVAFTDLGGPRLGGAHEGGHRRQGLGFGRLGPRRTRGQCRQRQRGEQGRIVRDDMAAVDAGMVERRKRKVVRPADQLIRSVGGT